MLISLLFQNPISFVFVAGALVISISVHEFAHAYVAYKLGDPTPKAAGRVTLDPRAHLDPIGTVMLLVAGFGWGKPVPFNPNYLRNPKVDAALISLAGPLSNLVLASLMALVLYLFGGGSFLYLVIFYNLILGFFNLIPLHPLDGFKVVNGILPPQLSYQWLQMAPFGIYILMTLILTGAIGSIIIPLVNLAMKLLGLNSLQL